MQRNQKKKKASPPTSFRDPNGECKAKIKEIKEYWEDQVGLPITDQKIYKMVIGQYHQLLLELKPLPKNMFNFLTRSTKGE